MEDVFSPADLIGPRPQLSFNGQQRRPSTDQQRLPPPGSRGRCGRCHLCCVGRAEPGSWSKVTLSRLMKWTPALAGSVTSPLDTSA